MRGQEPRRERYAWLSGLASVTFRAWTLCSAPWGVQVHRSVYGGRNRVSEQDTQTWPELKSRKRYAVTFT